MSKRDNRLDVIEVEGNNGGSFVHLERHEKDGWCYFGVGHDCVMRVPIKEIQVTELAKLLSEALNP
jgi:hypothetical protein